MKRPDEKILRSIVNLENNASWHTIVMWLSESLEEQSLQNNKTSGEITIRNQGRNLELLEILEHIEKARQYLS